MRGTVIRILHEVNTGAVGIKGPPTVGHPQIGLHFVHVLLKAGQQTEAFSEVAITQGLVEVFKWSASFSVIWLGFPRILLGYSQDSIRRALLGLVLASGGFNGVRIAEGQGENLAQLSAFLSQLMKVLHTDDCVVEEPLILRG
ncbi:hypothetical protein AOLI_G00317850 [Acnodon oligacanthus]